MILIFFFSTLNVCLKCYVLLTIIIYRVLLLTFINRLTNKTIFFFLQKGLTTISLDFQNKITQKIVYVHIKPIYRVARIEYCNLSLNHPV